MPNRIIREDYLTSEAINLLTADEEAFFFRLMLQADDHGRFTANLKLLKSALYPLKDDVRDTDIARKLAAAQQAGVIRCYEVDNKRYVEIPKFRQRIRAESKYPPPNDSSPLSDDSTKPSHVRTPPTSAGLGVVGGGGGAVVGGGVGRARDAGSGAAASHGSGGGEIPDRLSAIEATAVAGIDPEFAGFVFDDWAGRDGKDAAGNPRKWLQYVTTRWSRERKDWIDGTHKGKRGAGSGKPAASGAGNRNQGIAKLDEYQQQLDRKAARDRAAQDARMAKKVAAHGAVEQ